MPIKITNPKKPVGAVADTGDANTQTVPSEPAVKDSDAPAANDGSAVLPAPVDTEPKSVWQFVPGAPVNSDYPYDGLDPLRYALQYMDARYPNSWEQHIMLATHAGLPLSTIQQFAKAKGISHIDAANHWVAHAAGSKYLTKMDRDRLLFHAVQKGLNLAAVCPVPDGTKPAFVFHNGDEYAQDFIGPPELVEDVLPARGVAMVYGKSGAGKTFWVLDMAFHIHNGQPWRDKSVSRGNVFYIAAEAGQGVKKRLHGIKVLHPDWHAPYVAGTAPNLSSDQSVVAVLEAIKAIPDATPALVIIDTFSASFEGDDSAQKDVAAVVRKLRWLSDSLQCLVLFVHHPTKAGDSPRGSGVLMNDTEGWIEISTEGEGPNRLHVAMVGKVRDGEGGARYPFRLRKSDPLATKANGGFVTTCTVQHLEGAMPIPEKLTETLKMLQPVFVELSLEGPVMFGPLLKAAQAKHGGSGKGVKKSNAIRDVAKAMQMEEKDLLDSTEVWL